MTPTPLDAIVGAQIAIPKASKSPTLSHFKGTWTAFGDRLLPAADPPSISRDTMIQQHFPPFRLDQATSLVGKLRSDKDDPSSSSELNLDSSDPINKYRAYYYVVDHDTEITPVDPDLENASISHSSSFSSPRGRDAMFRSRVINRDRTCIVDGAYEEDCEAAHIIGSSLGNEYIKTLTTKRHVNEDPVISDINDVRNGLLMNISLYNNFGQSIAFLRVPNPFMRMKDIPSNNSAVNLEEER
ncbi:hypothetical protein C8Q75DRAFT_804454 [Abortiporus biennis]|nr:hypothetical protein C8Q75DRAFT_804454 [Abortiporus biennis]